MVVELDLVHVRVEEEVVAVSHQLISPLHNLQIVPLRQLWECRVRFGLVPKRRTRDVILERQIPSLRTPAEGLNRNPQVLLKADRVRDMPAVHPEALLAFVRAIRFHNLM